MGCVHEKLAKQVTACGGCSVKRKNKARHYWRESQSRDSATSGNPVSPRPGTKLYPSKITMFTPTERVYQRLPTEFGSGADGMACLPS